MSGATRGATFAGAGVAALLGGLFCLWGYGTRVLDGEEIAWLMSGDRAQSFLGWHFYRREPETFPLGGIASLLSPIGASLAYSDAAPWLSIALKPLSPLLPPTFQISGFWLLLCYALLACFGFLVLHHLLGDVPIALAGSMLVVMSPVLPRRGGHLSLCAQWLVVAAFLGFLVTRDEPRSTRFLAVWSPLIVLAGGTHPYLLAMVVAIALASCLSGTWLGRGRARTEDAADAATVPWSPRTIGLRAFAILALAGAALFVFGYIGAPQIGELGFGIYSANALALVDPDGASKLLPDLTSFAEQHEGYGFLGIAPLALFLVGAVFGLASRRNAGGSLGLRVPLARLRPLAITIGLLAFFALSSRITMGSLELATLSGFYGHLDPITSTFRSSGRFVWPLHYAIIIASVVFVAVSVGKRSGAMAAILLAIALQLWDTARLYAGNDVGRAEVIAGWKPLKSPAWRGAGVEYAELRLVPPYVHDAPCVADAYPPYSYVPFAYLAGLEGMRINSGHLSRQPFAEVERACKRLDDEIASGKMARDAIYVVSDAAIGRFTPLALGLARCGLLDRFNVCVRSDRRTKFAAHLAFSVHQHGVCTALPGPTPFLVRDANAAWRAPIR